MDPAAGPRCLIGKTAQARRFDQQAEACALFKSCVEFRTRENSNFALQKIVIPH
jgi:hypothetical protein